MERSNPKKQCYLAVRWPIFCLLCLLALSSSASSQIRLIPPTPNQNSQQPGTAQQNPVAQPGFSSPVAPASQISPPIARTAQAPTNASVRGSQPDQTANTKITESRQQHPQPQQLNHQRLQHPLAPPRRQQRQSAMSLRLLRTVSLPIYNRSRRYPNRTPC